MKMFRSFLQSFEGLPVFVAGGGWNGFLVVFFVIRV